MKYRTRKLARAYLLEQGVTIGATTLAQLALTGEGPRFRYWGRRPVYTEDDLDDWIQQKLGQPVRTARRLTEQPAPPPSVLSAPIRKVRPPPRRYRKRRKQTASASEAPTANARVPRRHEQSLNAEG